MIRKKDLSTIQSYLEDSSNISGGFAGEVIIPETQEEVTDVLIEANTRKCPVTISGGGTGTSGGRVPFGGIVLSMKNLNKIKSVVNTEVGGYIVAEAGVLIEDLKKRAGEKGLYYTYDPTEQTAFVGGTVATNASGARSFKYGSTRRSVMGLSVALVDGGVLKLKRGEVKEENGTLRFRVGEKDYVVPLPSYKMPGTKSSAGYYSEKGMDLIDLFIGQEGTLGCILEATLKLNDKPDDIFSCFAFFEREEDARDFAVEAKKISIRNRTVAGTGIDALSLEYFDKGSLRVLGEKFTNVPGTLNGCVFFEQETSKQDEDKVIELWQGLLQKYGVSENNTWVAMNEKERRELLDKRHYMGEAINAMVKRTGMRKVTTDIAVPHEKFSIMMDFYKRVLNGAGIKYLLFGHIGDAHIHMNLLPEDKKSYEKSKKIALEFIKKSVSLGGTVSAEHGIGKMRREYLKVLYGEKGIREMIRVKKVLDPNLILGKGNIFEV